MGLSYKGHKIEKYNNPFTEDNTSRFKNTYLIFSKDGKSSRMIEAEMMFTSWLDGLINLNKI